MNWLDIVILVIMAISVFLGLRIGLIKAVLSLVGVIVGVMLAGRYYSALAERLSFISQAGVAKVIAFAIILIVVMIVAIIIVRLLQWVTSAVMLGWVNHLGGAILGLVLGAILSGALLAIWTKFFGSTEIISQSSLARLLLDRFPAVLALLPNDFASVHSLFQ
ncbi:MAG: CvpA family protein [Chloroflexi bacterium]|nr:CvpA family protein [Chloroflexota bacterium]